jgi:M6 family metalloprotease-like protein
MRRKLLFFSALLAAQTAFAIPALPVWQQHRQADGTVITYKLVGDEHFNFALTRDNIPLVLKGGDLYYAQVSNGSLVASARLAHDEAQRQQGETQTATSLTDVISLQQRRQAARQTAQQITHRRVVTTGTKKGLVILVQFSDKSFTNPANVLTLGSGEKTIKALYTDMLNKEGYTDKKTGAIGSVHDYFKDQSNGKFDLSFDVVGPITLSHSYSYYGEHTDNDNDANAPQMIIDACKAVKDSVDFSRYDWDGDGEVEQVYVVYAGEGEATGGDANTVWPHKYNLSAVGKSLSYNGVKIDTYACSNEVIRAEVNGKTRTYYMGIGTICHEFSHCLGLPDLYDTGYGGNVGTGQFDLMCSGSYNGGPQSLENVYGGSGIGMAPAGYTAYERAFMGWLKPVELDKEEIDVTGMKGLTDGGQSYVLYNPDNKDEYYLFENRSNNSWDSELPAHGLLVTHVDYDAMSWNYNMVNAARYQNHPRLTIVPADDYLSSDSEENDTYPYNTNNSLTGSSSPALSFYTGYTVPSTAGITKIAKADDETVSFHFTPLSGATAIRTVQATKGTSQQYYLPDGRLVSEPVSGQLVIVKNADGTVKKVVK